MDVTPVLPLSFVMVAGPQIISAIFLATGPRWAASSAAYVAGAALSVALVVTIAYIVGDLVTAGGEAGSRTAEDAVDVVTLGLVAFLALRAYRVRHAAGPPARMARLQTPRPGSAFELGAALLGLLPVSAAAAAAAGLHVAAHGDSWWEVLPFVGLTLLLLALPALAVLALGDRATGGLPRVRDWVNERSWVVSELALALFAAVTLAGLVT